MPTWYYFARPHHTAYHDFTKTKKAPKNIKSLLGLGLKFIPTPPFTHKWSKIKKDTFDRLKRSLKLKFYFSEQNLANENDDSDAEHNVDDEYNSRMYIKSNWTPPPWHWPGDTLDHRLAAFDEKMSQLFKCRRGKPNLLKHQQHALHRLTHQHEHLIVPCDKNLGPSIIETEDYLRIAFRDHLNDKDTYKLIPSRRENDIRDQLLHRLQNWLKNYKSILTKMEHKFIKTHMNLNTKPFARFYVTLKAHKLKSGQTVDHLKSRPIVSCPGSLLHPLGIWVDSQLQKVAQIIPSYFSNSFELKQELLSLNLPPNARLFTADAISMYTNIPTSQALTDINEMLAYYRDTVDSSFPYSATREGLRLVMTNNYFQFGGLTFKQKNGTAMGTPPAPPYATIYYGKYEAEILETHKNSLLLYRRFIDDVLGIFLLSDDPSDTQARWETLQNDMNKSPGLSWEFSELTDRLDFMDLNLHLTNGKITTSLYEKPMNLHLYIPPHSAHPPGLMPGIVFGSIFRIYTLCSNDQDRRLRTKIFFQRLLSRGYKADKIRSLFAKAITRGQNYTGPEKKSMPHSRVILHLQYHPNDPPSYKIQQAWKTLVAEPPTGTHLKDLRNPTNNIRSGIDRMIIAYSRPKNLGNYLSHRNFTTDGPPISSYLE